MKSCRDSKTGSNCRHYAKAGLYGIENDSPPLCKLKTIRLDAKAIQEGCNAWTEPASQDEIFIEKVLMDTKLSSFQKFQKIYSDYEITEDKSYGTSVIQMVSKTNPDDVKFIFGSPEQHEIVNKFCVDESPVIEKHLQRIPEKVFYIDHDDLYWEIAYAYNNDFPMAMWGHTGTGKSELVKQFAAIIGAPVYRVNFNGMTVTDDIIGKLLPGADGSIFFQDGGVTECVRYGGILLLEELNACSQEVLFAMHGLLDGFSSLVLIEKDNEIVPKHPDCKIYSTMNPSEFVFLYPGTKDLSQAFAQRWPIFRQVDFMPNNLEETIIKNTNTSLDVKDVKQMVKVASLCRTMMKEGKINFVFSTRVLKNWAKIATRFGMIPSAELSFLNHMDTQARKIIITEVLDVATNYNVTELKIKYL